MTKAFENGTGGLVLIGTSNPSAASNVSFTNLTAGKRYRVLFNLYAGTAGSYVMLRFKEGSVSKTASYFGAVFYINYLGTSGNYYNASNTSSFQIIRLDSGVDTQCLVSFDLVVTNNQNACFVNGTGSTDYDATQIFFGIRNSAMATFDGFELYPSAGTFTGTIKLYEYR